jgi:hypothetical protein
MKILIIEDDINKLGNIMALLRDKFAQCDLVERHSYQAGLKTALLENPDILVLDMTMSTYNEIGGDSGGRERRYAGQQILRYLRRKKIKCNALVITQFEHFGEGNYQVTLKELDQRLSTEFGNMYHGAIFYQAGGTAWMTRLTELLNKLLATDKNEG